MNNRISNEICRYLREVVENTRWEGHIYAVGGCIRDEILGSEIKDIDIAVDIPGGGVDFARWLHKNKLTIGRPVYFEKYGTAKLLLRRFPSDEIETVQTRAEKYTKETSRCPEVVAGSIEDDCFRRDFTVNTLYKDLSTGEILDLTGRGVADIRAGVLRTPLNPEITFDDDPVRILRCLRFASRFNWEIDPEVWEALLNNIPRLSIVSKERHRTELGKMLTGKNPVAALELLQKSGATEYMLPIIKELASDSELWNEAVRAVSLTKEDDLALRLAALFHDAGKLRARAINKKGQRVFTGHEIVGADMVRKALKAAKFEPAVYYEVARLIRLHHETDEWGERAENMTDTALRKLQSDCGSIETLQRLMALHDALTGKSGTSPLAARVLQRTSEMIAEGSDGFSPDTDVTTPKPNARRRRFRQRFHNTKRNRRKQHKNTTLRVK